jgi:hypothetical protein
VKAVPPVTLCAHSTRRSDRPITLCMEEAFIRGGSHMLEAPMHAPESIRRPWFCELIDVERIRREEFPITRSGIYLDNATLGPYPTAMSEP